MESFPLGPVPTLCPSLISFYDQVTGLVNRGRETMSAICLYYSKALDTVSHNILISKLNQTILRWLPNGFHNHAQRIANNDLMSNN